MAAYGNAMGILANNPLNFQKTQNETNLTNAQIPGIQADTQARQLANQQAQQQLKDSQIFSAALGQAMQEQAPKAPNPNGGPPLQSAPDSGTLDPSTLFGRAAKLAAQNGMSGTGLMGVLNDNMTMQKNAAMLNKEQWETHKSQLADAYNKAGSIYEGVDQITDPVARAAAQKQAIPQLAQLGIKEDSNGPLWDKNAIYQKLGPLGLTDAYLNQQKGQADTAKLQADAAEIQAKTPGEAAGSAIKQSEAAAIQSAMQNPKGLLDQVTAIGADPATTKRVQSMVQFALTRGDYQGAVKAVDQASQQQAEIEKETSPAVQKARTEQAVATEQATTPLKIQQQVATARALRAGDNPAVANVAPADIPRVTMAAQKLDQDYVKARQSAEDVGRILDMADAGNKAAGANVPLVGVGALNAVNGIKRINSAEISQYGHAGSLLDKIQGKLQGWTEGKPVPTDVISDMRALHQELATQAYGGYKAGLDALNARSQSRFAPVVPEPNLTRVTPATNGGYKAGDKRVINGVTVTRDAEGSWQ
jgi:hypothetical protein